MTTMDENSRYVDLGVVIIFTKLTVIFIDEFSDKLLNLIVVLIGDIFGLPEKEHSRVLQLLHLVISNFI